MLKRTVLHCLSRRAFGYDLSHFELVQMHLSRMAARIYGLESMVYMTAGMADVQIEQDLDIESNMCKLYALLTARCLSYLTSCCSVICFTSSTSLSLYLLHEDTGPH